MRGRLATLILCTISEQRKSIEVSPNSAKYREQRYATGGGSGAGSYSEFAEYRAKFLNAFVAEHDIKSVIEFGCGDGSQLGLTVYPEYLGLDVSDTAIGACRKNFFVGSSQELSTGPRIHNANGRTDTVA